MNAGKPARGPAVVVPKLPYALLGVLTLATFGGPALVAWVLSGGRHGGWPPDRPVEAWTLAGVSIAYVLIMATCVGVCLRLQKAQAGGRGR